MKKKFIFIIALLFLTTACFNNEEKKEDNKGLEFKNDYEELNGKLNANEKEHRTITISEKNVFVEVSPAEVLKKIENGDSFYVYFGSRLCPWCRSVIEMADKVSRLNDIEKIYYVDVWDDEVFRDQYKVGEDGNLELVFEGDPTYKKMLENFNDLLRDYTLTDSDGNTIEVGEKRIYAPNFVYISKGKATRLVTGKSDKQEGSRDPLTQEMLDDQEKIFDQFFINACDDSC